MLLENGRRIDTCVDHVRRRPSTTDNNLTPGERTMSQLEDMYPGNRTILVLGGMFWSDRECWSDTCSDSKENMSRLSLSWVVKKKMDGDHRLLLTKLSSD